MYSMTRVPTKLATLVLSNAIDSHNTTLAVVRLNKTSVSMNFQNPATVGTSPIRPYTIPPNMSGGTSRSGRMSNKTYSKKKGKQSDNGWAGRNIYLG